MSSFLLRNARLVELGSGPGHDAPVDVQVVEGRVSEIGPRLDVLPGIREYDAEGRWLIPGLWDQHVHLGQWTVSLPAARPGAASRSPEEATAMVAERLVELPGEPVIGWGHRLSRWDRDPTVTELDAVAPDTPVILISGDGHHAWLNTTALIALGAAGAGQGRLRARVVRGVLPPGHARRQRRHLARGVPAHPRGRRRDGRHRHRRLRVQRRRPRVGRAVRRGRGPAARPDGDVRRRPGRRDRRGPAHRRRAAGLRRADHDGAAEGDLRRLPEHPHGLVLRPYADGTGQRRAQPVVRGAPRPARPRGRAPPRGRDPRDRRRAPSARRSTCTPPRGRGARSSTPSSSSATTYAGSPTSASGPASSRPTCSTTATPPSGSGRTGRTAASPCAGCSTTG